MATYSTISNTHKNMNENKELATLHDNPTLRKQLANALPKWYTPEQFASIARTQLAKNPKLRQCTTESFMQAMLTAAEMGLPPDGRHAHLIPRYNKDLKCMEAKFQDDYKGLIALARRGENVSDVYAELVCANDDFEIHKGLHRDIIHKFDAKVSRGTIIGAYAVITYKDGTPPSFEFMDRKEIEHVRDSRSESWKSRKDLSPWTTDEGEMFRKTPMRRLFKTADLGYEVSERLSYDADTAEKAVVEEPDKSQEPSKRQIGPRRVLPAINGDQKTQRVSDVMKEELLSAARTKFDGDTDAMRDWARQHGWIGMDEMLIEMDDATATDFLDWMHDGSDPKKAPAAQKSETWTFENGSKIKFEKESELPLEEPK